MREIHDMDLHIAEVDEEKFFRRLSYRDRKPNERTLAACRKALELGRGLIQPKATHRIVDIEAVEGEKVCLEGGRVLKGSHLAKVLSGAGEAVVTCCTIGPACETNAEVLMTHDPVTAYALDVYGSIAVSETGRALRKALIGAMAGLKATAPTSPGQLDWSVSDQKVLFDILHPEEIGVSLTSSAMMKPRKSLTSVFGVGDPAGLDGGHPACDTCPKRSECDFHRESGEEPGEET